LNPQPFPKLSPVVSEGPLNRSAMAGLEANYDATATEPVQIERRFCNDAATTRTWLETRSTKGLAHHWPALGEPIMKHFITLPGLAAAFASSGPSTPNATTHIMKPIQQLQLARTFRLRRTFCAVLAGCFAAGLVATHAAQPSLRPLVQPGKWPASPRGAGQGLSRDVTVVGRHAYVADFEAGLQVIDVSNPTNCVRVGGHVVGGYANGVAVSGNYAYVATGGGLSVIDVSNPTNCVLVGCYESVDNGKDVAVSGHYAYLADYEDGGLQVIDVSDPANPVRVGGYVTSGEASGVAVVGNYAYVAAGDDSMQVIDVRNPTNCCTAADYGESVRAERWRKG
jgi:hypothetical protein